MAADLSGLWVVALPCPPASRPPSMARINRYSSASSGLVLKPAVRPASPRGPRRPWPPARAAAGMGGDATVTIHDGDLAIVVLAVVGGEHLHDARRQEAFGQ